MEYTALAVSSCHSQWLFDKRMGLSPKYISHISHIAHISDIFTKSISLPHDNFADQCLWNSIHFTLYIIYLVVEFLLKVKKTKKQLS